MICDIISARRMQRIGKAMVDLEKRILVEIEYDIQIAWSRIADLSPKMILCIFNH